MERIVVATQAFAEWATHGQIACVPPPPSLALASSVLPVRSLAMLTARANLGGPRETLLGVLQAARLVISAAPPLPLPEPLRRSRAHAARSWLAALSMPVTARAAIARVVDASAGDDLQALAAAWEGVVQVATPAADQSTRAELRRISARLAASP